MRYRGGVILLAGCLCLTGCSLFGKKSGTPATQRPADPPPPRLPSSRDPTPADTVSNSGVLAGQIRDYYNHRPSGMYIRVVDLDDLREPKAAPIEQQADAQGYFTIAGLRPGAQYQLIARGQEGDRVLAGTLVTKPPNPRLTIWVTEETVPASGTAAPPPATPGRSPDDGKKPAASLEAPVKSAPAGQAPTEARPGETPAAAAPSTASPPAAPAAVVPDPSRTAQGNAPVKDGFQQRTDPPPVASVPSVPRPPGIQFDKADPQARPAEPPPASPSVQPAPGPVSSPPGDRVPVPSCQLVGRKLVNLALYEENGRVWEYRKDRTGRGRLGRLVLLDFWSSTCGPCRRVTPKLVDLHQQYGPWGLEVVGVAYESGSIEQQVALVRGMRGRYGIRYPTLLGAGARCPVLNQFDVQGFPTLVLLDENGEIIFRSKGIDDRDYQELVVEIRRRLIGR